MNYTSCSKIINSIKADNLMDFSQLVKDNQNLCFGRFPILSICYLYGAKKIIKSYESKLCQIKEYKIVDESFEVYNKFKQFAGRCLRLYLNHQTIVSPLEMLAILHRDYKLKRCYKTFAKNITIINNLNTIYKTIYGQTINISPSGIKLGKSKLNYYQKRSLKTGMLASGVFVAAIVVCMAVLAVTVGIGLNFSKAKIQNASQLVSALKMGGNYVINNNFTIDGGIENISFSGQIDGQNHTIYINYLPNDSLILQNNGSIKNLNIVYNNISGQALTSKSLLAKTNNGTIDNVSVTCNQLNLSCAKTDAEDLYISGFACTNSGYIKNCKIKLISNVTASGQGECYVSGFAGTNNGTISSCEFMAGSEVQTTDVDLAGFAIHNAENANISACKNYANLTQTSELAGWSPNVSGIAQTNYGAVTNCYNYGTINASSTYNQTSQALVFVGGISATNYGVISHCLNKGELVVTSNNTNVYCGGISAYSSYYIKNNQMVMPQLTYNGVEANFNVSTTQNTAFTFVGGISGFLWGETDSCYSVSTFTNGNNSTNYFVGLCLGCAYIDIYGFQNIIRIDASNNYMLEQSNVSYQLGSLINNGTIVSKGQDTANQEVVTLATKQQIQQQEVYWTDEN